MSFLSSSLCFLIDLTRSCQNGKEFIPYEPYMTYQKEGTVVVQEGKGTKVSVIYIFSIIDDTSEEEQGFSFSSTWQVADLECAVEYLCKSINLIQQNHRCVFGCDERRAIHISFLHPTFYVRGHSLSKSFPQLVICFQP